MKVLLDTAGFVTSYATVGDLMDSVEVTDLDEAALNAFSKYYPAYQCVDGTLVLDEEKLAELQTQEPEDPVSTDARVQALEAKLEAMEAAYTEGVEHA